MAVAVPGLHGLTAVSAAVPVSHAFLHGDSIRMKVRGDSVPKPGQLFVLSHSGMYVILCNVSSVEGRHLDFTFGNPETIDDIKLLRSRVEEDLVKGVAGAVPIPLNVAGKEEVIAAVVSNIDAMIKADCGLETTAGKLKLGVEFKYFMILKHHCFFHLCSNSSCRAIYSELGSTATN
ncbi:hypothetical protein SAY86_016428 [Trapa natans]|uniref:Uncharacterized protein n=1 Tax=Trapa natans TaxID=22666 RepID=A0AAN7QZG2_TRANT|nr:hypothetical protein SAY86_016428 [Trapa natans]